MLYCRGNHNERIVMWNLRELLAEFRGRNVTPFRVRSWKRKGMPYYSIGRGFPVICYYPRDQVCEWIEATLGGAQRKPGRNRGTISYDEHGELRASAG